jgi:hypothetical protein
MAVTQVQRKLRRLRNRSQARQAAMKRLTAKPVIRKVDVEELKKSFSNEAN